MKALTIQQPFAEMIRLGQKLVENRTWACNYRGPLAVHAGKGKDYLRDGDRERYPGMAFGAVVAVAELAGCVPAPLSVSPTTQAMVPVVPSWARQKWPWLASHEHTEGPYCFVLAGVRALASPVPCKGAMGLWDVPEDLRRRILEGTW